MTPCRFCGQPAIKSHIIPASIHRAVSKQDGSVYLRRMIEPNLQVQDIKHLPLLCGRCDGLFSDSEETFIKEIYKPLLSGSRQFDYGHWLQRFAISLAWKTLADSKEKFLRAFPEEASNYGSALDMADSHWTGYLRGSHNDVLPFSHHLLFTSFAKGPHLGAMRAMSQDVYDCTIANCSGRLTIFVLFPGCIFLAPVTPRSSFSNWQGTRIESTGSFNGVQGIDGNFAQSLNVWMQDAQKSVDAISEKQWKVIERDVNARRRKSLNT